MRKFLILITLILSAQLVKADNLGTDEHNVRMASEKIMDGIIEGLRTGKYAKYSHDFHPTYLSKTNEKAFKQASIRLFKSIGKYTYRDYMGFVTKGDTTIVFWKAKFSRYEDDIIIILTLSKEGNIVAVKNIKFNRP